MLVEAAATPHTLCTVPVPDLPLERYRDSLALVSRSEAVGSLARAIAASPSWRGWPPIALVARANPEPLLALLGRFSPAQAEALAAHSAISSTPAAACGG